MLNLLRIELFKIFRQRKTWYAIAAVFVLEGFIMASAYYQGRDLLDVLLENLQEAFEFQGNLLNGNIVIYLILNSFWFHIPLIIMVVVSGFLTSEYKDRTIEAVLLQPVSKVKFILSKYLAALVLTACILCMLILSTFLLAYLFFGKGDLVVFLDGLSFFESGEAFRRLLWAFLCGSVALFFYAIVSLTLAVLLQEATITWIVAALLLVLTSFILRLDLHYEILNKYFYAKLTDGWQMMFYPEIPIGEISFKTILLALYSLVVAGIGIRVFVKRDVT